MPLTLTRIKALTADQGRPRRESDGGGLFIEATTSGSKLWKMNYRYAGRQKTLSFGAFPAVSLVQARAKREEAKQHLANGTDPGAVVKAIRRGRGGAGRTFDDYAGDYIEFRRRGGAAAKTLEKATWLRGALRRQIGGSPITDLTVADIIAAVRDIEKTGRLHKSTRAISLISSVFRFAGAHGAPVMDPGPMIRTVSLRPENKHYAAVVEPARIGEMLRAIDGYQGDLATRYALRIAPHVFLRDGEIRALRWAWVDRDDEVIRIPAEAMKMRRPHLVPLSAQVLDLLDGLHALSGRNEHLFPSPSNKGRSLSSNTLNSALRRLGYPQGEATFHGFRTTASTRLNEMPSATRGFSRAAIEAQLAHEKKDKVEAAYNRATLMDERRVMMAAWSDLLDEYRALPAP